MVCASSVLSADAFAAAYPGVSWAPSDACVTRQRAITAYFVWCWNDMTDREGVRWANRLNLGAARSAREWCGCIELPGGAAVLSRSRSSRRQSHAVNSFPDP